MTDKRGRETDLVHSQRNNWPPAKTRSRENACREAASVVLWSQCALMTVCFWLTGAPSTVPTYARAYHRGKCCRRAGKDQET